jgi:molybdenum cofactor biosynthesis enzyme MoaA
VTRPFCGDCTRARISADGQLLHLPLHAAGTTSGRSSGTPFDGDDADDARSGTPVAAIWRVRDDRYSELRTEATSRACRGSRCSRWAGRRRPRHRSSHLVHARVHIGENSWILAARVREFVDNALTLAADPAVP